MEDVGEGWCVYDHWGPFDDALGQLCQATVVNQAGNTVTCRYRNFFTENLRWPCAECDKCTYCGSDWCMVHFCCSAACIHLHMGLLQSV